MAPFWLSLWLITLSVHIAAGKTLCSTSSKCPSETPCCSQFGECGADMYCLGGCDPRSSFSLDSCLPAPVCKSKTYTWENLDNVANNTVYLGNATAHDWLSSGYPAVEDGNLLMTMPNATVGTLMSNNHYLWYGRISARIKTTRGQGVVSAFILMSDVQDEIDFEWVGSDLETVETNFYFQGVLNYTNGGSFAVANNTFENWHTYEIDWTPDAITWYVDGEAKRTLPKDATWNATSNQYMYPQTPSRLQMSIWPAGTPDTPEGTVEWAGGLIDWNNEDMQKHGYYYVTVGEVNIECYEPPSSANITGYTATIYTDYAGLDTSVQGTNKSTTLKSDTIVDDVSASERKPSPDHASSAEFAVSNAASNPVTAPQITCLSRALLPIVLVALAAFTFF
ncbi:hypothetical protein AJ80_02000 [Polytolypa hystricis UAMH7299]|uniref:Crh-like protein n=1 Tax=Polytolypa hystricis (strain UAMH7299) TaxID=1447883 RepID=A0A2B7YSR5_POLH7|nr:hypothetical protein AJ80_02000 [Polytolypa hystricis UAMH7299]